MAPSGKCKTVNSCNVISVMVGGLNFFICTEHNIFLDILSAVIANLTAIR